MPNKKNRRRRNRNKIGSYRYGNNNGIGRTPLFQSVRYPMSTQPTTFGPGRYRMNVTKLFTGRLDVQQEINVFNDILATNPELGRVSPDFKYMLCEGIAVTFPARNLPVEGNMTPAYLMFNLDGTITENIRLQDNVKTIPPYLSKDKILKFKLPGINVYGGVLNKWFSLDNIAYSFANLVFQLYAPSNTSNWYIRFDVIITLRGPTNVSNREVSNFENRVTAMEDKQADRLMLKVASEVKELKGEEKRTVLEDSFNGKIERYPYNQLLEVSHGGFMLVPPTNKDN